jgi:short-subunit dehydrogenase
MEKYTSLNGKVVVITGATSGVGRATAIQFARHGSKVVLVARREEALNQLKQEVEELGASALTAIADVTDAEALEEVAKAAILFGGKIHVWVNNAGVLAAGEFTETPIEVHDRVIETNLIGYLHGAYAVLPYFKRQGYGTLINNISVGGWFPTPYAVGYSASKFGLRGFSEALRGELRRYKDIHVCELYPAFLDTPGMQHAANYTKVALKPAPPVYDPQRVAKAIVSAAHFPKNKTIVGSASGFLRFLHFLAPTLTLGLTGRIMETYFKHAKPIEETSGNLFESVEHGTSIYGGWTNSEPNSTSRIAIGAILTSSLLAGFYIMSKALEKSK